MKLCLRCRRWSPRGSLYCVSGCGSFGGSRCAKGHLTPGLGIVTRCPTCRSADIVTAVASVSAGWAFRLAAWAIALLVLREGFARPVEIFKAVGEAAAWLVGPRLLAEVNAAVSLAIALRIFLWCVAVFDPERARRIDPFPRLFAFLGKSGVRVAVGIWRLFVLAVEGRPLPAAQDEKKGRKSGGKDGQRPVRREKDE